MIQILTKLPDTRADLIYEHDDQGFCLKYYNEQSDTKYTKYAFHSKSDPLPAMAEIEALISTAFPGINASYRISPSVTAYYHQIREEKP